MKTKLLLLILLANFSIYAQTSLVPNPNFENWTNTTTAENWTSQNSIARYWNGPNSVNVYSAELTLVNATLPPKITALVPLKAGVTYTVKFDYKYVSDNYSGDHPIALKISQNGSASSISSSTFATNNAWTEKETTFTADSDMSYELSISTFSFDNKPFKVLIDHVEVYVQGTEQYTLIPDLNFEKKLISLGIDSGTPDGKVLTNNVNTIRSLNIGDSYIVDLTGIQDFTELTSLGVYWNKLTTLNVSKNTKLKSLSCGQNFNLGTLDLSNNPELTNLDCYGTGLTNLDLSKNLLLTSLDCNNNKLTTLDVSKLVNLQNLVCSSNLLTTLDTSNNPELSKIDFYSNKIASFDASKHPKLTSLRCDGNPIETLDLSTNKALTTLSCSSTKITSLDLSKNTLLTSVQCNNNNSLKQLNLKNGQNSIITVINLKSIGNLSCILVDNVSDATTKWATFKDATTNFSETVCEEPKYTLIPDPNFEKHLVAIGVDGTIDGKVITSKIATITSVSLYTGSSDPQISTLTGIEDFAALEELSLPPNSRSLIKNLDLSKNTKIKKLNCTSGVLETLNISSCLALIDLSLSSNNLTSLDLSNNTALTSVNLSGNKLTSLDLSQNTNITGLNCSFNQLTTLNVSKNLMLTKLELVGNKIASLDVSSNLNLTDLTCNQNWLTSLNISKNIALTTLKCNNNSLASLDISNSPNLKSVIASRNSLTAFNTSKNPELTTIDFGYNKVTSFDASVNAKLITLSCYENALKTLDVSKNQALTTLDCGKNQFASFDLSKNYLITTLKCADSDYLTDLNLKNGKNTLLVTADLSFLKNPILNCIVVDDENYSKANWTTKKDASATFSISACAEPTYTLIPDPNFEDLLIASQIDKDGKNGKIRTGSISNLTSLSVYAPTAKIADLTGIQDFIALESLNCAYNAITTLDLSKNLSLKTLRCSDNKLVSLNITKNSNLQSLDCSTNEITALDISQNIALNSASLYRNKLAVLDISKNTALTKLLISNNLLATIDVSQNTVLKDFDVSFNKLTTIDVSKNAALTDLNVSLNQLTTIDVSKNTNLVSLVSTNNQLTSLDVSKNTNLTSLSINYNKVNTLDLSSNVALTSLLAVSNNLTSLNISNNKLLNTLEVSSNKISSLDVSKNAALKILRISENTLNTLDVSQNPALTFLSVTSNQLTSLNLRNGKNTLIKNGNITLYTNPKLYCVLVDDIAYSNTNWSNSKDAYVTYNTECTGELTLPANNFAIETKGESCLGENNGEISIVAKTAFDYVATVNDKPYTFTNNSLKVTLAPGVYKIKITIPNMIFEQNFNVTIAKGATIAGKSSITSKKVDIEITEGTAPFTVFVDGAEQFQTTDSNFSLELSEGGLIEVATAKACEGVYAKKVKTTEILGTILSAYPNPTSGSFEIEIPTDKNEVVIELYNFGGQLVSSKTYTIENGTAKLNLENQPSGIYAAKIYLETPEHIKIIKK
ncbi:T9SS type A sorting domain-containing protein [Flavobacterium sp. Root420]|uniref:T9SS type A sorting domain-containing protein n=1 Tax=Flavobacterium sp. Root420 TaxID=1736533 RepID=UPI0006FE8CE4|nr:T9SS type A sorting domain-containing protein [Flavobacterium sp. Root420]KQX08758.1 hypothetical protein ASC72_04195 [Flavobacterium sp. Root420]